MLCNSDSLIPTPASVSASSIYANSETLQPLPAQKIHHGVNLCQKWVATLWTALNADQEEL